MRKTFVTERNIYLSYSDEERFQILVHPVSDSGSFCIKQ